MRHGPADKVAVGGKALDLGPADRGPGSGVPLDAELLQPGCEVRPEGDLRSSASLGCRGLVLSCGQAFLEQDFDNCLASNG